MSFLDRYLMAKSSSPANDDFVYTNYVKAAAVSDDGSGLLPALDPAWSIYVASLVCLRIAIKAHSPYGDRGSPFSSFPPEHAHAPAPFPSNEERMAILSDHWSRLRAHPDQMDPHMYRPVEDTLVAHLVAAGGPGDGGGGTASTARPWCAGTARAVLVRTETDVLHALEFRLIPITSWAVAHDLVALVDGIVRRERLAQDVAAEDDRFRRLQHAAMLAETAAGTCTGNLPGRTEGTECGFDSEEDKDHRLGGSSSSTGSAFPHTTFHGPRRFPINIDRSRLTELTTQQLASALEDGALLSVPRSVLARAAVQNALVRLNVESEAAAGVSIAGMVVPGTEPRSQYEAGRALVGSLCAEMRFVCTTPYGEWEEDCQENTEEEYETEIAFHIASAGLQKHLNCFLDREMMETTGRYHGLEARTGGIDTTMRSAPRVVTPCWDSSGSERSANDGKDRVAKEAEFGPVDEGGSTADSALDIASEWQHQAKKARKGKKRGVGRLHTSYSPGYGGSGRAILNK